jgi:hypothetical protein
VIKKSFAYKEKQQLSMLPSFFFKILISCIILFFVLGLSSLAIVQIYSQETNNSLKKLQYSDHEMLKESLNQNVLKNQNYNNDGEFINIYQAEAEKKLTNYSDSLSDKNTVYYLSSDCGSDLSFERCILYKTTKDKSNYEIIDYEFGIKIKKSLPNTKFVQFKSFVKNQFVFNSDTAFTYNLQTKSIEFANSLNI